MGKIKQLIAQYFGSLTYFYRHIRYRLFLMVFLSIIVGILDGFGLAMFMPLLELVNETDQAGGENLGNLQFLVDGMKSLGLPITLISILMVMVVFFSIKGIFKFIQQAYQAIIRQYFIVKLRSQLLAAFNNVNYKYYVTSDVGRIQNTMTVEVERVSGAFYNYASTMEQAVLVLVYMAFAFFVDMRFALLVTLGGGATNLLYNYMYKKTKGASRRFTKDSHLYQGQIIQHVTNFKYLKATAFLDSFSKLLLKSVKLIEQSRRRMGILNAILQAAREPLLIIVIAVVVIIQINWLNTSLGPILVSLLFFYRALSSVMNMQNSYNRFLEQSGSVENVVDFQNILKTNKESKGNDTIHSFKRNIVLNDINFAYASEPVLKSINLEIKKNETVAFVGESGSGKTTLVNLITGLISPDNGVMLIDDINSRSLDINSYQRRLGYITQEPTIFNDTIYNNVTLWEERNDKNVISFEEALKKAEIKNFVELQPEGEKTILGISGVNLSGGQKQRIAIARELYKDIDILIMDEATSALDSETENLIQKSIEMLKGRYTILIVAHRLSTIKHADRIVFMKNGEVVQTGTFDELINISRDFKRMAELQEMY